MRDKNGKRPLGGNASCSESLGKGSGADEPSAETRCFRVTGSEGFRLVDRNPEGGAFEGQERPKEDKDIVLQQIRTLATLQEKLYAQGRWGLLVLFQAMDAGGKDSCIKHIFSGVNPQGCQVVSFKTPSVAELQHDYLWRCVKALPERGYIGVFNRSYYENVLITRVHPEALAAQNLPEVCTGPDLWRDRYEDIVNFERYLTRNGYVIRKFFLHISKEEQRKRLRDRLEDPSKHWKFAVSDLKEREYWDDYQKAYEDMIRETASPFAPWYVVPANHKWFARQIVVRVLNEALEALGLEFPQWDDSVREAMAKAEKLLAKNED